MKKLILFTLFLACGQVQAASDYVGQWCNRYDDFTEVLLIDHQEKVTMFSIGNDAGEVSPFEKGYISRGASHIQMNLNGVDIELSDIKVGFSLLKGKKKLTLKFSDGESRKFYACKVTLKSKTP